MLDPMTTSAPERDTVDGNGPRPMSRSVAPT
jgi:hypothetical protein